MLVELGFNGDRAEATLLVGLSVEDVERLRAGEELSFRPRDAGLVFHDEVEGAAPRMIVLALGDAGQPNPQGRLCLTESMIQWMRETTPISQKLAGLGMLEGTLVLFHGKTDEDTSAAIRRHKGMLARTLVPDTSVQTTIALDRKSGRVSVSRSERSPLTQPTATREAHPTWLHVIVCALGSIASFAGAFKQHDAIGRAGIIACGVVLAGVGAWFLRHVLRRNAR
jgi:hypothetical protein